MKKNICFSALIALGLFATGCAKDEGNYNYNNLSTNFVDTTSLLKKFSFKQNEVLNINPGAVEGVSDANLEYEWRLIREMYAPDPVTGAYFNKLLATTKNLSYKFVDAFGNYVLVLLVKDKANGGITQMVRKNIRIIPFAMPGWMVLHGDGTSSDVSIVVNDKITNANTNVVVTPGTDSLQKNVYSITNGSRVQGDAAGIYSAAQNSVGIFTMTSLGGYRLSAEDFGIKFNYNDLFTSPIPTDEVQFQLYERNGVNELLVNKGDIYYMPQPNSGIYNKFGIKLFGKGADEKALDFTAAPYIASNTNSYAGVFYDTKNKRFLYINSSREIKEFLAPAATAAFDPRNVGKEMVYAENGYDFSQYRMWYSIMQSPGDPSSRELFGIKLDRSDDGIRAVTRIPINTATEINNAKHFAFGNKGPVMYYGTDSKIYQFSYAGAKTATQLYDITSAYPGSIITGMKLFKTINLTAAHKDDGKLLYVALYNPASKAGTLLQIVVDATTGAFGAVKAYTGFGKISSMAYKPLN